MVSAPRCKEGDAFHGAGEACSYRVAWAINPHMVIGSADPARAQRQHEAFLSVLEQQGARVSSVAFVHGAYDSIFAKDSAVLVVRDGGRRHALLAHSRFEERRREQESRARSLLRLGFKLHESPGVPLEGGDVAILPDRSTALLGVGFRSTRQAAPNLARFLGMPVVPLELRDPAIYHLDMALSLLRDGTALVCEEAFTRAAFSSLGKILRGSIIPVSRPDALRFGCNVVEIADAVVMGSVCPPVALALRDRGRRVIVSPLDEFHRAGGSAACLVARVHEEGSVAESATAAMRSTAA